MGHTIKDIAREAGVSDATVSLSFSGHPRISEKTRTKVLKVAARLKYSPNLPARALRSGGINAIGFVVNDITNPFYAAMIQHAEGVANERGFQLIVAESQWNPQKEIKAIETMISSRIKGLLVILTEQTTRSLELLKQSGLPMVAVDTHPPTFKGSFVGNDLHASGFMAATHLLEAGCKHPLLLTAGQPLEDFSAFVALKKGFLKGLKSHSIEYGKPPVITAGLTIAQGALAFSRIRTQFPKTDGILCANDLCAFGVMKMADEEGIIIGEDLRLMGIDDLDLSAFPRISLTSIRQPYDQIAQMATTLLTDHIKNQTRLSKRLSLPPKLIIRRSTNPDHRKG